MTAISRPAAERRARAGLLQIRSAECQCARPMVRIYTNRKLGGGLAVARTLWQTTTREPDELRRGVKAAERLQSCGRLRRCQLVISPGRDAGFSIFRSSKLDDQARCTAPRNRISN